MAKTEINFGIIGAGLMGREFASAIARWPHLLDSAGRGLDFVPRIVGVASRSPGPLAWFSDSFPDVAVTTDYRELLANERLDAVYVAVPHYLHAQIYTEAIEAGKHLFGEKPFGMDQPANDAIVAALQAHPAVFARCTSEFPFWPGAQEILRAIRERRFGRIVEVEAGLWHSSDLDPKKAINWKRQAQYNGEYGCLGDLGMHALHIPLRAGWMPTNVRALLSKIVAERPDIQGRMVPCDTWDNATLACEVDSQDGKFPMLISTKRIAPGEANTWFLRVMGTSFSAEFSTKYPRTLRTLTFRQGQPQTWEVRDLGYTSAYPTITGGIFEFGFGDAMLQMIAAFCDELVHRDRMLGPLACPTPEETALQHRLLTAALKSGRECSVVRLDQAGR